MKNIISEALSAEIDENSNSSNVAEWDSLGHLSVLSALDAKTDGKTSDINGIGELDSFQELKEKLVSESIMNED